MENVKQNLIDAYEESKKRNDENYLNGYLQGLFENHVINLGSKARLRNYFIENDKDGFIKYIDNYIVED